MFAAIYVPDFPLEAVARAEPELREQAVAVVEGTPPLVHVVAVNERAAQAGVEPGMTKLQAEERLAASQSSSELSGRNDPTLSLPKERRENGGATAGIRQRSAQREAAAHAALLDCACGFSPRVEDTAPDTVLLDLAGLERIFGPPAKMARDVARRCSELGLEANVAVASNPDAALLAARGFPGVTVIPPGEQAERLGGLPVDVLAQSMVDGRWSMAGGQENRQSAIDNRQFLELLDTLDRWGIRNLRALAALPEVAVTERLGQDGLRWQRLARGATSRPLVAIEPPLAFEEAIELDYPAGELEPLSFLLNRMLEQLCARLAARVLAASEVRVRLMLDCGIAEVQNCGIEHRGESNSAIRRFRNSAIHERTLRLPVPMLDAKVFLKLLQLDLQANPPGAPVTKVWLSATPAEPRRAQDGLFLPAAPQAERLEVTLAKIKRVVGATASKSMVESMASGQSSAAGQEKQRAASGTQEVVEELVGSPELLDTHRPDGFTMKKFMSANAAPSSIDYRPSTPITALRLFRPPPAAAVALRDGRPARLTCPERPALAGAVTWCAGPWRSSGEWWSEQAWWREEWDVAVGEALYRIYRDTTGWFVEGSYD